MTWYLFRHGLATHSTTGYGDTILTASILPESIEPTQNIAHRLLTIGPSIQFSSSILRCIQTTDIISNIIHKPFTQDKRLNEYYQDTFETFSKRILNFVTDMEHTSAQNIIVCTHGSVIAGIHHYVVDGTFLEKNLYEYPECGELLIIHKGVVTIENFNE
jgi:broad specificity phosphatase PhoE